MVGLFKICWIILNTQSSQNHIIIILSCPKLSWGAYTCNKLTLVLLYLLLHKLFSSLMFKVFLNNPTAFCCALTWANWIMKNSWVSFINNSSLWRSLEIIESYFLQNLTSGYNKSKSQTKSCYIHICYLNIY